MYIYGTFWPIPTIYVLEYILYCFLKFLLLIGQKFTLEFLHLVEYVTSSDKVECLRVADSINNWVAIASMLHIQLEDGAQGCEEVYNSWPDETSGTIQMNKNP